MLALYLALQNRTVPITSATAPAYAFLATIVRDNGHIERNRDLLSLAMQACPENISYALNYLHSLELVGDFEGGLEFSKKFIKTLLSNDSVGGSSWKGKPFHLREIYKLLEDQSVYGSKVLECSNVAGRVDFVEETDFCKSHVEVDGNKQDKRCVLKLGREGKVSGVNLVCYI